jgi:hypothetical protein
VAGNLGVSFSEEQAQRVESSLDKADNDNLDLITERFIYQQEAAAGFLRPLRVHLDGHGRVVRLTGAVQVEPNAEMSVRFRSRRKPERRDWASLAWAAGLFASLGALLYAGRLAPGRTG